MGAGDCLVKLPGQIKGLFQREPEAVLLSSGMREEKAGCLVTWRAKGWFCTRGMRHVTGTRGWQRSL